MSNSPEPIPPVPATNVSAITIDYDSLIETQVSCVSDLLIGNSGIDCFAISTQDWSQYQGVQTSWTSDSNNIYIHIKSITFPTSPIYVCIHYFYFVGEEPRDGKINFILTDELNHNIPIALAPPTGYTIPVSILFQFNKNSQGQKSQVGGFKDWTVTPGTENSLRTFLPEEIHMEDSEYQQLIELDKHCRNMLAQQE